MTTETTTTHEQAAIAMLDTIRREIRAQRARLGVTLEELSSTSGVSYANISKFESGKSSVNLLTLCKLAAALNLVINFNPNE